MIETVTNKRVPPAAALRQLIAQRKNSVAVMAAGLGPVLAVLDAYIVATEDRLTRLECGQIREGKQ